MGDYAFSVSEIFFRGKQLIILCHKNNLQFFIISNETKNFKLKYDWIFQNLDDKPNYPKILK